MSIFRKGDVVTIEAAIASTPFNMDDGNAKVRIEFPPFNDAYVNPADLTMLRPYFEVGDMVKWTVVEEDAGHGYRGIIRSIANDHLWVELGAGNFATIWTGNATRIDPAPLQTESPEPSDFPARAERPEIAEEKA